MRHKLAHPVQEDFDFLIVLTLFSYPLSCRDPFEGYCFFVCFIFAIFEVFRFILVLENKCDCSPHKSALSCFCCIICALS